MSEAIISRRGRYGNGSNEPSTPPELQTRTFYSNTTFTVPNYRNGGISVRIFGGGGIIMRILEAVEEEVDK